MMNVHPSQRRMACEICKKHKAKCQRIQPTDLKCSRCTMLGVDCDPGSQKKVGRPRRSAPVSDLKIVKPKPTTSRAKSLSRPDDRRRAIREHHLFQPEFEDITVPKQHGKASASGSMPLPSPATTPPSTVHELSAWPSVSPELSLQTWSSNTRQLVTINNKPSPMNPYTTTFVPSPISSADEEISDGDSAWPILATIPVLVQPFSPAWPQGHTRLERNNRSRATGALRFDVRNRTITDKAASATMDYNVQPDLTYALSKIGLELELRRVVIEYNKATLDLDALIYQQGPLFINNYTLGEFLISTTQDFLHVLNRCQENVSWNINAGSRTSTLAENLPHALACSMTSIFTQLTSFYELFLEHMTNRIERIHTLPVALIPGLTFNGKPLAGPCDQGLLFCHVSLDLIESLESVLGVESKGEEAGLLSAEQIDALWNQLDGSDGVASGRGIMRPADVKSLFRKMAVVFKRLSLTIGA